MVGEGGSEMVGSAGEHLGCSFGGVHISILPYGWRCVIPELAVIDKLELASLS